MNNERVWREGDKVNLNKAKLDAKYLDMDEIHFGEQRKEFGELSRSELYAVILWYRRRFVSQVEVVNAKDRRIRELERRIVELQSDVNNEAQRVDEFIDNIDQCQTTEEVRPQLPCGCHECNLVEVTITRPRYLNSGSITFRSCAFCQSIDAWGTHLKDGPLRFGK